MGSALRRSKVSMLGLAVLAMSMSSAPVGAAGGAAVGVDAPLARSAGSTSTNWSGYDSIKGPFDSVSASWVQPKGTCTSKTTYAAFWVGLDGDGSSTVEQTGSEVDCSGGKASYSAWYEMYPKFPVNFASTVKPGDHISASVTYASPYFTLVLADSTQGWTHTLRRQLGGATRSSAEIIAEAPSSGAGVLPLTDFGTAQFSAAKANGTAIGNDSPRAITMASGGVVKAQPSALSSGTGFTVTWKHS